MLLRVILCGGVWNGFLLGKAKKEDVPCRFCGKRDGDGHLFWECSFPSLQHVRDMPEFAYPHVPGSVVSGLDVYSGMVGCLVLRALVKENPWALSFGDLASFHLERCLGAYPVDFGNVWTPPDYWDVAEKALKMPDHPNVWTSRF